MTEDRRDDDDMGFSGFRIRWAYGQCLRLRREVETVMKLGWFVDCNFCSVMHSMESE